METLEITAAVLRTFGAPFELEQIRIDPPRPGELLVRIVAVGICHADAHVHAGLLPIPLPAVLGHEGAGIVEAVGEGVAKVEPGDHVVLTFASCGLCTGCLCGKPTTCDQSFTLNFSCSRPDGSHALHDAMGSITDRFFAQSSFATYAIATERNVVKVSKEAPLALLGPLGCGVQTGAGSVLNTFQMQAGETIAVFGAGSVGLSAVMAAKLCGAATVIAIDVVPSRLELARELGATHLVNGGERALADIREISGPGVHYALDTTGNVSVIRTAIEALRSGGTCGILGSPTSRAELQVDPVDMIRSSKSLRGIVSGDGVPDVLIPRIVALHAAGSFPFDRLIRFYDLDQINEAFADCASGTAIKPVLRMAKS